MKIKFVVVGKTDDKIVLQGLERYETRLKHYIAFERIELPAVKIAGQTAPEKFKKAEEESLLRYFTNDAFVVLLDEKGTSHSSRSFAQFINQKMNTGLKQLIFIVGGPYGFSEEVYQRAHFQLSLSAMTFSHQMVRLFFVEQVYRAMTILKGESYHHD